MRPKVSIIIPFKEMNSVVWNCISRCLKLNYDNFNIILLPDGEIRLPIKDKRIKMMPTGKVHPSIKRNKAIFSIESEYFASIDSDAYPHKDWIKNSMPYFKDEDVAAVGGPNLTKHKAKPQEVAANSIVYSELGMNTAYFLKIYKHGSYLFKEIPSSNLILKAKALKEIKGYDDRFLTGEDTILGIALRRAGYKIIFSESVIVHHRRRPLFMPHLNRIFLQAQDKALILKKVFSFDSLIFFIPTSSIFILIFGFIFSIFDQHIRILYVALLFTYMLLVLRECFKQKSIVSVLVLIGLPLTHIVYGLGFLKGILIKKRYQNKNINKI